MIHNMLKEYMSAINCMEDKEYLFARIAYYIAPTLVDHKPSTIITLNQDGRNCYMLWDLYKEEFKKRYGIECYEMRRKENGITILFYQTQALKDVIYERENMQFLKGFGYEEKMSIEECLGILKGRFESICPHEIGIFLGIPLEDVITFIECPNKECLLCGYWKAYSNIEDCRIKFFSYDRAKKNVIQAVLKGIDLSMFVRQTRVYPNIIQIKVHTGNANLLKGIM
ncbi:DUF3793 family protein [Clostridium sp. MSJ-11]|uniref:DUF3793 family protein n=1 Tax=Clostridium mobile TaxID=2841512 RepID=A0ABS6EFJ8_9CLOT|nr:DUF3793 family protein [Clostridium mobile]MBU5483974.1 DUF3793 family protein [Clostridium mobile]